MATMTDAGFAATLTDGYTDFGYLAVGTGTPSGAGLGTETERVALTTKSVVAGVRTLIAYFTNTEADDELTEWGLYDAASGGNLLAYGTFDATISRTATTKGLKVTITETLSNA